MFLKKLTLNGFKSFSSRSEITFVKGISAIVGPNGCGKSNVIDALKWVIGEQKVKMLRANSMSDVIFKGTEDRKGLGRAEVKLTLVNEQNILPIDFNEVEISRIIYASGENEYFINKNKVRLKDIQELFYDTGIGKSAYSIMEQGKIDMILSNKPEDRRYIIEEAAGITKYRVKRMDSLNKLRQTNENIIRIKDIIEEVKGQYDSMKKQAEKAKKYKELNDKEIDLEIELNLFRINKNKKTKEDLEQKLETSEKKLKEVKDKLDNLEDGVEEQLKSLNNFENRKINNQREVFKIQSDMNINESKVSILKEQLDQHRLNHRNDNERIVVYQENIKELDAELQNINKKKEESDNSIFSFEKDIKTYNENIEKCNNEINRLNVEITNVKEKIVSVNNQLDDLRVQQKSTTEDLILKMDNTDEIFDIDGDEITKYKNDLHDNIAYIKKHLPKRMEFIHDITRAGHVTLESSKLLEMLNNLYDELKIIEDKVVELDENTNKYIKKTEKFLNEIFGPSGILTKKREIENKIHDNVDKINKYNLDIDNLQKEIVKNRDKKEEFDKIKNELNINLTSLKEKRNSYENEIKRLLTMRTHHESSMDELLQKIKFYDEKIKKINTELTEIEKLNKELIVKKEDLENQLVNIDKEIENENLKMTDQQQDIKNINSEWMKKKNDVQELNIKIVEANTTINNIYDSFYESYSIDLTEYIKENKNKNVREYNAIKSELTEVKSEKHSLGSVNLMAIEEAGVLEERYNLLKEQLEDLEKAKKDIFDMIDKINQVSEELFLKTFNQIKSNFQKIFRKLFNGGNAELTLTDPENILETGIDIIAHPPGQKTQNITLLSGGQRTMTAIALMFAAFFVKPSPFCLLDEIDAALDEQNIRRFVNLLTENKDLSQFIIITHNNTTISAADVMYGVTQEEEGISKIVSAKFAQKTS